MLRREIHQSLLQKRYASERRFRLAGLAALVFAGAMLAVLLFSLGWRAVGALTQAEIRLPVYFAPAVLDPKGTGDRDAIRDARYGLIVRQALVQRFPTAETVGQQRELVELVSRGAKGVLREMVLADPSLIGKTEEVWLPASDEVDLYVKGQIDETMPEAERALTDRQIEWIDALILADRVEERWNAVFFQGGDSREPELSGMLGSMVGSFWLVVVCLLASLPCAVATALYLQEFAPKNRWTDWIEININNLAAVPSIIFGLLGLSLYLQVMHLPRSSALAGGLTVAMMILPTIIIATRAALRSVPEAIRDGARALGATPMQVTLHHVLPLAVPGIMTGTILGIARALGETAPLLMIGMVAFVADVPGGMLDPATAMPVQVFLWADSPELAFASRTALAIVVLLGCLMLLNAVAVFIRQKFERKW